MTERLGQSVLHRDTYREQTGTTTVKRAVSSMAVAIVNYNTCEHLRACLASVASEQCEEVVVVDNASSDGSAEMAQADYPWVRLLVNKVNCGYGAAANQAIAGCSSGYILLLNSDTLLRPGTLQELSHYLDEHPQAAIVGPRLLNPDGTLQASCFPFPTPLQTLLRESRLATLVRYLPGLQSDYLAISQGRARVVPWVLGAALTIRREAFEAVGGFDNSFFMYFEEVDLCYRLHTAGWEVHFAPVASVTHVGAASTQQHRPTMTLQLYQSLCHFYRQHYPGRQTFWLKLVLTYLMLRNILRDSARLSGAADPSLSSRLAEDLPVWRSVLSNVWSSTGWLR